MKKILLTAPEHWPPEAKKLYLIFAQTLSLRVLHPRSYLLQLRHFFLYQHRLGLSFRECPKQVWTAYLETMPCRKGELAVTALKTWLRFLFVKKELLLPIHEEVAYPGKITHRRRVLLSHQQVLALLRLPPQNEPEGLRDRAILEMVYATGMRRGEFAALDLADLDLSRGLVSIRRSKNYRQRTVPLTKWALHFLQRYLRESRPQLTSPLSSNALWLNKAGRRLPLAWLSIRLLHVYNVRETLGFPFTIHQLRHACATHLLTAGASLRCVQELLGHVDIRSTQLYTHITPAALRRVHERCHPRNNGSIPGG